MKQILIQVLVTLLTGGTAWAVVKYLFDRRDSRPQREVAAQTVAAQVDAVNLTSLERRLSVMERLHREERDSLEKTIGGLRKRVEELERQARQVHERYRVAIAYIRSLRGWIDDQIPDHTAPPVPATIELDD